MIERPLRSAYSTLEDYVRALESYTGHLEFTLSDTKADMLKAIDQVKHIMQDLEKYKNQVLT